MPPPLRAGNNSLTGTIPPNLTTNSQLLTLELHNNTGLYGTFPNSRQALASPVAGWLAAGGAAEGARWCVGG
jgi:hypothetical protein